MATPILIRGGGDLASGVALRLHRAGLSVIITELLQPLAVRRTVSFAEAIYEGQVIIEGVSGRGVSNPDELPAIRRILSERQIPVAADPDCVLASSLRPAVIVDGRMTKQPPEGLAYRPALLVGLGPGFVAPKDVDAVVETRRGHTLGRVSWEGGALEDTSQPEGDPRRVLRAPRAGLLESTARIGDHFEAGQPIAKIGGEVVSAPFSGVLRGLLRPGLTATSGMKIGDLDGRDDPSLCRLVSDKALAVGGGVLEALLARPEVRDQLWD
jgi:xanthine dehydrogenase accessory factor